MKKQSDEFRKVFAVGIGLAEIIKTCSPGDVESLDTLISSLRDNLADMRKRGFIDNDGAQSAFYSTLVSLSIYERRELLLGLFLKDSKVQKRPFVKDAIYTLVWWFGFRFDLYNLYRAQGLEPGPETAMIDSLVLRPGGYWGAVADYLAEEGITGPDAAFTGIELKKQYATLKDSRCKERFMTYYKVGLPFTYSLEARRIFLAKELMELYPL